MGCRPICRSFGFSAGRKLSYPRVCRGCPQLACQLVRQLGSHISRQDGHREEGREFVKLGKNVLSDVRLPAARRRWSSVQWDVLIRILSSAEPEAVDHVCRKLAEAVQKAAGTVVWIRGRGQ